MRYIDSHEVIEHLKMEVCISLMREALGAYSAGEAKQLLRLMMPLEQGNVMGLMPSNWSSKQVAGVKVITVFPGNFQKGLPSHQGLVMIFETETGALKAIVDGGAITAIRTAAVSAVATDVLAKKDAKSLAILGAGVQARKHLEALLLVRDLENVTVWDVNLASAQKYAQEMQAQFSVSIRVCEHVEEAVREADIICTVTSAQEPILWAKHVQKGAHINGVGACSPYAREMDSELIKRSKLFTDSFESLSNESGDYLIPLKEGIIDVTHVQGEIGQVLLGAVQGRQNNEDITIFKALGLAVEDLCAADYIFNQMG